MRPVSALTALSLLVACGSTPAVDAGPPGADAATSDAASTDAATSDAAASDASTAPDAGRGPGWHDREIGQGILPSLAIAADGTIHVGHVRVFAGGTGQVLYSTSTGGAFRTDVVAEGPRLGWNVALALSGGAPRVAYADPTAISGGTGQVFLAALGAGGWTATPVPAADCVGLEVALAFGGDVGAIAYVSDGPSVARSDVGPWTTERVEDGSSRAGGSPVLALDGAGEAHVAYGTGDGGPGYGHRLASGWALETIHSATDVGVFVDLALGPGDAPFVVYTAEGSVWEAERTGTGWTRTMVGTADGDDDVAIAVDGAGVAHVAWATTTTHELRYASSADGWIATTIGDTGTEGTLIDLALDPGGRPHVAYTFVGPTSSLRLASLE